MDESLCFAAFGMNAREADWVGHGLFWRPRPLDSTEPVTNMASNCMTDYDVLEDGIIVTLIKSHDCIFIVVQ
jgi:hypothetical protein